MNTRTKEILDKYKSTLRGMIVGMSLTSGILLVLALGLLTQDLRNYEGKCPGSILPFIGEQKPYECSFTEYVNRHGRFSLEVLIYYHWYWGIVLIIMPTILGGIVDWYRSLPSQNNQ